MMDEASDFEDATWRWGLTNMVQLPSPMDAKEAYLGFTCRKKEQGVIRLIDYVHDYLKFTVFLTLAAVSSRFNCKLILNIHLQKNVEMGPGLSG